MDTRSLVHIALFLALISLAIPGACGWTLSQWSVSPSGANLPPGTEVSASYSMHFDSWMTGTTFDNDNSLVMYTDLVSPHWTVTKKEAMDGQEPIIEDIPVRQGMQVRLDGWTLSYTSKRFDVVVKLTGMTPSPNQTTTISLVKLQEMEPGAKAVSGTLIKKEAHVVIPTQEPTPVVTVPVTVNLTPAEFIEVTPDQTSAPSLPTVRQTYTPGPGPAIIVLVLACLVLVAGHIARRP